MIINTDKINHVGAQTIPTNGFICRSLLHLPIQIRGQLGFECIWKVNLLAQKERCSKFLAKMGAAGKIFS